MANEPLKTFPRMGSSYDRVFIITPSDTDLLPRVVRCLRIFNDLAEVAYVKLRTTKDDVVTLSIPPMSILWEDVRTSQVYAADTSDHLVIHGYTD